MVGICLSENEHNGAIYELAYITKTSIGKDNKASTSFISEVELLLFVSVIKYGQIITA